MTNKEAIETIKAHYPDERYTMLREALDMAMELLEAQEPVEPRMDYDGQDVWRCGLCGAVIFHPNYTQADEDERNYAKFCRHCGRAVKWE